MLYFMENPRMNTFRKMVKRKRTQPTAHRDDVYLALEILQFINMGES